MRIGRLARGAGRAAMMVVGGVAALLLNDPASLIEGIADRRKDDGDDTPAPPVPRAETEQRPPAP